MVFPEGSPPRGLGSPQWDVSVSLEYDPLTRTVHGVITNGCDAGYLFFYRIDPKTAMVAEANLPQGVWDGQLHLIEVTTR